MTVHSERRGPQDRVVVITLDRPERRNALDRDALVELRTAIADAADARALVLTGANGHFCSGADITGLDDESFAALLQEVLDALHEVPFPTIAAVDGAALGAGTQLAVACDLRVATPGSRFGIPAAKLGVMVSHWTVQRLALLAGAGPARAMLLAAEVINGDDAHRLGLANRAGYLNNAVTWAEEIAELAPLTIAGHKVMLNHLETAPAADAEMAAAFSAAWQSADFREGRAAFREHRKPNFTGE